MTEPDEDTVGVVALLDRAGGHSPSLHVSRAEVVQRGRRLARRRRAGAVVGTLALAGALWLSWAVSPLADAPVTQPATWSDGEIGGRLFGLSGEGAPSWRAELRTVEGQEHPELAVTRDGEPLPEVLVAEDGPAGTQVFRTEGLTVAVWMDVQEADGAEVSWGGRCVLCVGGAADLDGQTIGYAASSADEIGGPAGLYLVTEGTAATVDGREVESTQLSAGGRVVTAFLDEQAGVWGVAGPGEENRVEVMTIDSGAGTVGGAEEGTQWGAALLPEQASDVLVDGDDVSRGQLGAHELVLSVADAGRSTAVTMVVEGERMSVEAYSGAAATQVGVGEPPVTWSSTREGFLWLDQGDDVEALSLDEELRTGGGVVVPVDGGTLVVVPDWDPGEAGAAMLVAGPEGQRWEETSSVRVRELSDGRPVTFLAYPDRTLGERERVLDVGIPGSGNAPERLDLDELVVTPLGD